MTNGPRADVPKPCDSSEDRPKRIGVFGGTFDPPHIGHLVAAVNVRHQLSLDLVLLVVANEPWQKAGDGAITPAADRLAMVRAAVDGVPGLEASDLEIRRGGLTYTADTLAALADRHPGAVLFLGLGEDAAAGLPTWERIDEVRRLCRIVVVTRPGSHPGIDERWVDERVEIPRLDLASTDLRRRVADGRPIDFLVPAAVAWSIQERGLYGGALL
ncbi:MAG: nicotinate (nicotinamide) nucleotide adenylyltransferase [Actinobacteria bacterium]|nr:nicotinate (nicotinamide) nucleotide adenylyltransferase [Actinomycetota bacterium]